MPRNRQNGTSRLGPPRELVGKDFIWNPFTGKHDYLFGSKGSRKDFFCGSEVSSDVTETHRKSNGFDNHLSHGMSNAISNKQNQNQNQNHNYNQKQNQMDIEPSLSIINKIITIESSP